MIDFWIFPLSTIWGAYQIQGFLRILILFKLGKSKDILKYICLIFISFLPLFYLCCIYYFGLLIFCCHFIITALKLLRNHYFENLLQAIAFSTILYPQISIPIPSDSNQFITFFHFIASVKVKIIHFLSL